MKIIIIDDEFSSLNTFLANVVDEKDIVYNMFMDNIEGAISYVKNNDIDAAFLDINMPKINGVDLAEELVKIDSKIHIVFITGYDKDENLIKERLKNNLLGFCNKPYDKEILLSFLGKIRASGKAPSVFLKTFPSFDLFVGGKLVEFKRSKSKELLALLTDRRGSVVSIGEAVAYLWGDKKEDLGKKLYRDAVSRLRLVLEDNELLNLVNFGRGSLSMNCANVTCDLWNFMDNEKDKSFCGDYMLHYEWSTDRQNQLWSILDERQKE